MMLRAPNVGQRLDDHVAVGVVARTRKMLAAAHAVERLEDDVAELVDEGVDVGRVARHQRGRR
jgi:hypothetical protein